MSWRVSYYKANKEKPVTLVEDKDEETGELIGTYYEVNGEMIINNEGTQIWLDEITDEQKKNPELFTEIVEDEDCDYFLVTKAGLRLIIEKYRENIIKLFEGQLAQDPEYGTCEQYTKRKLWSWKHNLEINLDYDKHIGVTTSSLWEYTIFNLIYLYRNFDFDNYVLVLYGG